MPKMDFDLIVGFFKSSQLLEVSEEISHAKTSKFLEDFPVAKDLFRVWGPGQVHRVNPAPKLPSDDVERLWQWLWSCTDIDYGSLANMLSVSEIRPLVREAAKRRLIFPDGSIASRVVPWNANETEGLDDESLDGFLKDMFDEVLVQAMFLDQVLSVVSTGVLILSAEGEVTVANQVATEILDTTDDQIIGVEFLLLFEAIVGVHDRDQLDMVLVGKQRVTYEYKDKNGADRSIIVMGQQLANEMGEFAGNVVNLVDITHEKQLERTLREKNSQLFDLSYRDSKTGTYNMAYLDELIEIAMKWSYVKDSGVVRASVLNICGFRNINYQYGCDVGDALLAGFGSATNKMVNGHGYAIRYGGDEFLVLSSDGDRTFGMKLARDIEEELKGFGTEIDTEFRYEILISVKEIEIPVDQDTNPEAFRNCVIDSLSTIR